jgi:hypothetical protein
VSGLSSLKKDGFASLQSDKSAYLPQNYDDLVGKKNPTFVNKSGKIAMKKNITIKSNT